MGMFSRTPTTQKQPTFVLLPQNPHPAPAAPKKPRQPAQDSPNTRYQINQRCIYERRLPGAAYMTAHVQRLQSGIYDDENMSTATIQTTRPDNSARNVRTIVGDHDAQYYGKNTLDGRIQKVHCSLEVDYNRSLLQAQSLHKALRKKANRASIRAEYLLDGQRRPLSYHSLMTKLDDLGWPPSPSSTSICSAPQKPAPAVYLLALAFVLHPSDSLAHRFKSAKIRLTVDLADDSDPSRLPPKIIKYAPHLISGSVSQETQNWTFNLAGSLGISQGPANASIQPSEGYSAQMTLSKMMKIQGSTRTTETGVEDGELLWTMEEDPLQQSGLPREFTFVLLVQDPNGDPDNIDFAIDVEPVVHTWYGSYPDFWQRRRCYQPLYKAPLDFRERIGQRFFSTVEGKGDGVPSGATSKADKTQRSVTQVAGTPIGKTLGSGQHGSGTSSGRTAGAGNASQEYNFAKMDCGLDGLVQLPGETYSQAR
ncbi:hypothetical protein MMC13_000446 [Lambiella insularis]|nr:hypothetical protein [Lambiella insularis]